MDNKDKEPKMEERRKIVPQGPAQEEVNEINEPGRLLKRPGIFGKIINTALALSTLGSLAVLKAKAEENAANQTPPQVEPSRIESQSTPPSAPGVKVQFLTADAPTFKIYIPLAMKGASKPEIAPVITGARYEGPRKMMVIDNFPQEDREIKPREADSLEFIETKMLESGARSFKFVPDPNLEFRATTSDEPPIYAFSVDPDPLAPLTPDKLYFILRIVLDQNTKSVEFQFKWGMNHKLSDSKLELFKRALHSRAGDALALLKQGVQRYDDANPYINSEETIKLRTAFKYIGRPLEIIFPRQEH